MNDRTPAQPFPRTFWTANTIELVERAAYYAVASFVVIFLTETLGLSPTTATFLNGSLLWGLIYFLPIVSGTLADRFGFKRSLSLAFTLLALGYAVMGNLHRFWPALLGQRGAAAIDYTVPVVLGILLIGIGGSIVKPCIAGTVQKTSGTRATVAFGIFYMVINIGSITGRGVSYFLRTRLGIPAIFFPVATVFALLGLLLVLFVYREPEYATAAAPAAPRRSVREALLGIFTVLRSLRFVFFLLVIGCFWFIYVQLYNLVPLFLRFVDPEAPVELYTLANPIMIVALQMFITRLVKRLSPVRSIMLGIGITTCGMLVNILPPLLFGDLSQKVSLAGLVLPVAGIFLIVSIASMALGEMMASPRIYEYLGSLAPKGQEGLYLGYANLPLAIGSIVGAPIGGLLFESHIAKPVAAGQPPHIASMWLIVAGMGLLSMIGMRIYDRWLQKEKRAA